MNSIAIQVVDETLVPLACRITENPSSARDLMSVIDKLLDLRLVYMKARDSQ
jgi:hypothetical protein